MKSRYYIPILALVIVIAGIYFYTYTSTNNTRTYPTSSNSDIIFYPINQIKQNNLASGTFNTNGFVAKIYTCPPCPKGAMCKRCARREHIVISTDNKILESSSLTENELVIFTKNPKQFKLGKKYKFTIKILDTKSTTEPINDIELVGYNLIE